MTNTSYGKPSLRPFLQLYVIFIYKQNKSEKDQGIVDSNNFIKLKRNKKYKKNMNCAAIMINVTNEML
jgi:hypothetical protein